MKIAIVGTGYVGLSNAIILSKFNKVYALDIDKHKVELINSRKSPIVDKEIGEYLSTKKLDLTATLDASEALKEAEYVVIATPTTMILLLTSLILPLLSQLSNKLVRFILVRGLLLNLQ